LTLNDGSIRGGFGSVCAGSLSSITLTLFPYADWHHAKYFFNNAVVAGLNPTIFAFFLRLAASWPHTCFTTASSDETKRDPSSAAEERPTPGSSLLV
jgi:hypothetical protein